MRIMYVSDLHLDVNEYYLGHSKHSLIEKFIKWLSKKEVAILLIGGDISNDMSLSIYYMELIERELGIDVYMVPGNHDLWGRNSEEGLNKLRGSKYGLVDEYVKLKDEVYLYGMLGWYDYSYDKKGMTERENKINKKMYWSDSKYIKWKYTDKEMTDISINNSKSKLNDLMDSGKKVWLMTHFVPFEKYIIYKNDHIWDVCNSFIGSKRVGDLIMQYSNIEKVFFGHTHVKFLDSYNGKDIICVPYGYVGEWETGDVCLEFESKHVIYDI